MAKMLPRFGSLVTVIAVMAFLSGAALLTYGRWARPIASAFAAAQAGDGARALPDYAESSRRFHQVPLSQRLLARDFSLLSHNQLAVLYGLGRYDEVIERAVDAPAAAAPHFWSGCALFRKSTTQKTPDAQLEWLSRAQEEFKLALAAAPDDWDTKFNYELTARLAAALRPASDRPGTQPSNAPATLMQLLRPQQQQKQQERAVKKVG
jgi:hypothetical protein